MISLSDAGCSLPRPISPLPSRSIPQSGLQSWPISGPILPVINGGVGRRGGG